MLYGDNMKEAIKAAEPLVIAILAVIFGLGALAMGYDGVVIMSVFLLLGGIVGVKVGKYLEQAQA